VLLILLLALAALTVHSLIAYLQEQVPDGVRDGVTVSIWSMTLGFMLIAGAFGLWAIQFSMSREARRRVAQVLGELDFMTDGLLAVDRRGRITGSSPSAISLASGELTPRMTMHEGYPCLTDSDMEALLRNDEPQEVQRTLDHDGSPRSYRFRSHPSEDFRLVQISDVTSINRQQLRNRQSARLQLIGQIANGVANDLNTILASIEGHTSLLNHLAPDLPELKSSLAEIVQHTRQGVALAGHIMEFGRLATDGQPTDQLSEHVEIAADLLRSTLPDGWDVVVTTDPSLSPVPLTGIQVEQTVQTLGLLAADALDKPGRITVAAARPSSAQMFSVESRFAVVIVISVIDPDATEEISDATVQESPSEEAGALESILQSMIGSANGSLERLTSPHGRPIYRVALPFAMTGEASNVDDELPEALMSYMSSWTVLLARPTRDRTHLAKRLSEMNVEVEQADDIVSTLARVEEGENIDVMVVDSRLFGDQAAGLLRAIVKLCPSAGIVVLSADPRPYDGSLATEVVTEAPNATVNRIFRSMIAAKSLGMRRMQA
jgi:signal transduction histidine kinase